MGNDHGNKIYLHVRSIAENVDLMKDMVPNDYTTYQIAKFRNLENYTTIIIGDDPKDLNARLDYPIL